MPDRPTKLELLEAVRGFLERELIPELEGVQRFHARAAAKVLGIVSREIELEEPAFRRQHRTLAALLGQSAPEPAQLAEVAQGVERMERELTRRIRAGDADNSPWRETVLAALSAGVRERLASSTPAYR